MRAARNEAAYLGLQRPKSTVNSLRRLTTWHGGEWRIWHRFQAYRFRARPALCHRGVMRAGDVVRIDVENISAHRRMLALPTPNHIFTYNIELHSS